MFEGISRRWIVAATVLPAVIVLAVFGSVAWNLSAGANVDVHGIGFSKGCKGPTKIGSPYTCTFSVVNSAFSDTATDTLTFTSVVDVVHATPADVPSGNILSLLEVALLAGGATCDVSGASIGGGATGNSLCTVPSGGAILFSPFSFYSPDATDPNPLTDTATLTWQDTCDSGSPNCPIGDQTSSSGSQSALQTNTPTNTPTPMDTSTPTNTPTNTPTDTPTNTATPMDTSTPTVTATPSKKATLTLGIKPCEAEGAPCENAEVLEKDNLTVSVEMKQFNIPGGLGYDGWETTVCFPYKNLIFKSLDHKGGPQGNPLDSPPTRVDATWSCVIVGASVGPDEAASQDRGNLANLNFACKQAKKDIIVFMWGGEVFFPNENSDDNQGLLNGEFPDQPKTLVTIDCRSGAMSASASGGFLTEHPDGDDPDAIRMHVKAGEKFKVVVSIDALGNLPDKDTNPTDGGGYTEVSATLNFDGNVIDVSNHNQTVFSLVPCTDDPESDAVVLIDDDGEGKDFIELTCTSGTEGAFGASSDENQGAGAVFTVTFVCAENGSSKSEIELKDLHLVDENASDANVFNRSSEIIIECIGDENDKDGDGCYHAGEIAINEIAQARDGIDYMDPNIYDWPDAKEMSPGTISIGDILTYIRNFGLNNPSLPPATGLGEASNPLANVHDVSQPNDDQIGTDDIVRAGLLFGIVCSA